VERELGVTMNQSSNHTSTKGIFFRMLSLTFVTAFLSGCAMQTDLVRGESSPLGAQTPKSICETEIDLNYSINKLSSEVSAGTAEVTKTLAEHSRQSPECRMQVITALIRAMDKNELNFLTDRGSFFLWSNGSKLLGELKAVEALDLLIQHLDLNDGEFSASMNHQPAVKGVVLMGSLAVPKLSLALKVSKNRNIRLAAALCLLQIDGSEALSALTEALSSESDSCVINFIQISLMILGKEHNAKKEGSSQNDIEALIELRRRSVLAFRCSG
jgi:hypothetical protein